MMGVPRNLGVRLCWLGLIISLMPAAVWAEEVGRFTQVEGQVELFKPGKPEAIPIAVQTGAEEKDRIKTEALSRAQIEFLDASTLTVAPLSDITIESYLFDKKLGQRQGLSKIAKGLVHLVLRPLEHLEHKEYLIKTSNAIMGIRGTELYILIGENFTDVYVKTGRVTMASSPVGQAPQNNTKKALQENESASVRRLRREVDVRGANAGAVGKQVMVGAMQAGRAYADRPAYISCNLTGEHFRILQGLMHLGLPTKLQGRTSSCEMLEQLKDLVAPLEYSPIDPALPSPPVVPFPGGGGKGGGVASPSS